MSEILENAVLGQQISGCLPLISSAKVAGMCSQGWFLFVCSV